MRSLLCYHQARWDQQEPPGCWIQRREANTISSQGETSLLVSFNTIKEGLKATKQHRQALARTARVSTSAYLRMAFDVLGLRACKLQHSSKAHWKRAKVKTRSHLKVKILPRKIAKHTPGFLQSMAQSSKDTIKPFFPLSRLFSAQIPVYFSIQFKSVWLSMFRKTPNTNLIF